MGSSYIWAKPISKCFRDGTPDDQCPEVWVMVVPTDQADQVTQYLRDSWNRAEAGGEIWSFRAEALGDVPQGVPINAMTAGSPDQATAALSPDSVSSALLSSADPAAGDFVCDETAKLTTGIVLGAVVGVLGTLLWYGLLGRP